MPRLIVWPCDTCLDTVTGYADRRLLAHVQAARRICREPRYVDARSLTPATPNNESENDA